MQAPNPNRVLPWFAGCLVLMFAVIWSLSSRPVNAEDAARAEATSEYYNQTCDNLRRQAQFMHIAGDMFDEIDDDAAKSQWWDRYQMLREEREQMLETHRANVAWQSSMGNPPPLNQACLL
ncbi:hypothetical protein D3C81_706610 [compost metagenome]